MLKEKLQSRKFHLVFTALILLTLLTAVPPMVSAWIFGALKPLVIITGSEFVSALSIIFASYFAANVIQKRGDAPAKPEGVLDNEEGEA